MMWYKAFSVWLLLRLGCNVLFQDVDLVWFKEPFSYFRAYVQVTSLPLALTLTLTLALTPTLTLTLTFSYRSTRRAHASASIPRHSSRTTAR